MIRTKYRPLIKSLYRFISDIKVIAEDVRLNGKRFDDLHDLPKVVAGCLYDDQQKTMDVGRSGRTHKSINQRIPRAVFNVKLVNALKGIKDTGKIPDTFKDPATGEIRFLGTCAEDDAANKVLNALEQNTPKLNELQFTKALRPRTGNKVKYCKTCQTVFS